MSCTVIWMSWLLLQCCSVVVEPALCDIYSPMYLETWFCQPPELLGICSVFDFKPSILHFHKVVSAAGKILDARHASLRPLFSLDHGSYSKSFHLKSDMRIRHELGWYTCVRIWMTWMTTFWLYYDFLTRQHEHKMSFPNSSSFLRPFLFQHPAATTNTALSHYKYSHPTNIGRHNL